MGILEQVNGYATGIPLDERISEAIADQLSTITGSFVYHRSIVPDRGQIVFLTREDGHKKLAFIGSQPSLEGLSSGDVRSITMNGDSLWVSTWPTNSQTAVYLRDRFPWLNPRTFGTQTTAGCGDRLGLATPGHVRAIRNCKRGIAPILAQQSMREMARTQRTPINVIDDAMWGVFQEGWHAGYGADADHLKTTEDIDQCVQAGFTFYTFDPGAYVDNTTDTAAFAFLPWADLETTPQESLRRYASRLDNETIQHAFVKYGKAVAHVTSLFRYLKQTLGVGGKPFEVEVSVDETEQPTTHAEHFIIASELRRLGVEWVSLAPRFVGRFEKGVDYIGDLRAFEQDIAGHAQIAREWGPYKLSIHSGSDKFSIYPIVARCAGPYVHLKTAGTSYLEALHTIARCESNLFRDIYALACERYSEDRASYHVSADIAKAPDAHLSGISDLMGVLDQFDARQMLHVCFGSILARYGKDIKAVLAQHEEMHYADLERCFERHLASFCN